MNGDIIAGSWKQFKGKVKIRWSKLAHDEAGMIAGRRQVLIGRIQEACGHTRSDADKQLRHFNENHKRKLSTPRL